MKTAIKIVVGVVAFVGTSYGLKKLRDKRSENRIAKADANMEAVLQGLENAAQERAALGRPPLTILDVN